MTTAKPKRASASAFGVLMECLYSFNDAVTWDSTRSWAARGGTASHSVCEYETYAQREPENAVEWRLKMSVAVTDNELTERQQEMSRNHLRVFRRWAESHGGIDGTWWPEVAFGYDAESESGYVGLPKYHRDYSWVRPGNYCGTADLVVVKPGESLWVVDYKFGRQWVDEPEKNWQMKSLSLFASRAFGCETVKSSIVRFSETDWFESQHTFDMFDLYGFARDVEAMHGRLMERAFGPKPGDHCRKCPGKASCEYGQEYIQLKKKEAANEAA